MPLPGIHGKCRGTGLGLSYDIVLVGLAKPEYSLQSKTFYPTLPSSPGHWLV